MRFLGIDPGLATVGLGIVDRKENGDLTAVDWLTIKTKAGLPIAERLCEIAEDLKTFLAATKPDCVVIERLFFGTNEKTALDVASARGVIVLTVASAGLQMIEPTPLQLKLAVTGDGGADKLQVQTMLMHVLKLPQIPTPDDAADALALAVYGSLHVSHPEGAALQS